MGWGREWWWWVGVGGDGGEVKLAIKIPMLINTEDLKEGDHVIVFTDAAGATADGPTVSHCLVAGGVALTLPCGWSRALNPEAHKFYYVLTTSTDCLSLW